MSARGQLHLHHNGITLNALSLSFSLCVGLSLSEVGNNRTSNNKVVCCHFSTDGKLLASAGHEKKVKCSNFGYT
jgi:hypothetical protein